MLIKGARPIRDSDILHWHQQHHDSRPTLAQYISCWRRWLTASQDKKIQGLDSFDHGDFTQGTSQCFDHFALRYGRTHKLSAFLGDFQYHACVSRHLDFQYLHEPDDLDRGHALIMSWPFSEHGRPLDRFADILDRCNLLDIPVLLDLAYWGISRDLSIDLDLYPCITQVVSSLSKSFFTLENHRVGVRFSRAYLDDGISMQNEVGMQNFYSMSLGVHFMDAFSCDWNWCTHGSRYRKVCAEFDLDATQVVIFGLSQDPKYLEFSRGFPGNYRLCISNLLSDLT